MSARNFLSPTLAILALQFLLYGCLLVGLRELLTVPKPDVLRDLSLSLLVAGLLVPFGRSPALCSGFATLLVLTEVDALIGYRAPLYEQVVLAVLAVAMTGLTLTAVRRPWLPVRRWIGADFNVYQEQD